MLGSPELSLGVYGLVTGYIFMPRCPLDGGGRRPDAGNRLVKGQEVGLGVVGRVAKKASYDSRVIDTKVQAGRRGVELKYA